MVESLTGLAKCAGLFLDKMSFFQKFRLLNDENKWEAKSAKNGLNMYTKKETSGYNSLLAYKIVNVPIKTCLDLLFWGTNEW